MQTLYYRVDYYKVARDKETGSSVTTFLGSAEVNDSGTSWKVPLIRKAALSAPFGCTSWDKIRFTPVNK